MTAQPPAGVARPLRNRVTPLSELIADPARGLVYGNRGCLHDRRGNVRRRYDGRRWIACRLAFRGRQRRGLLMPGRYTELFFLDEATALAAGHRPCAECRRSDYDAFTARWLVLHPDQRGADEIDRQLHAERVDPDTHGRRRQRPVAAGSLPDGAFVLVDDEPWLVLGSRLRRWAPAGYEASRPRPDDESAVEPLTPPSLLAVLRGGWNAAVPLLHPSARG